MFKNIFLAILLIFPITANAHSPLASSFPQSGEKLNVPPAEIIMVFKSSVKLIKVSLSALSVKQSKSPLGKLFGNYDGEPIALDTSPLLKFVNVTLFPCRFWGAVNIYLPGVQWERMAM